MTGIAEGYSTITPHILVNGADAAMDLYCRALGAEIIARMEGPGGIVMHAALQIGSSKVFIGDPMSEVDRQPPPEGTLSSVAFYVYLEDVDAAFKQAVENGMTAIDEEPADMFWGDRTAVVQDPYGYNWTLATQIRDVSAEEIEKILQSMAEE